MSAWKIKNSIKFFLDKMLPPPKPKSIKAVYMEVPCCFGLVRIVQEAMAISGEKIPTDAIMISIKGEKIQ
jgi:hypothetical protein